MKNKTELLEKLCHEIPQKLNNINGIDINFNESPEKWSKKEIIGHLIDSATINHHRFVRGQFEDVPTIRYDQNKWNEMNHYQEMNSDQIISFWKIYNLQILELIKLISKENLSKKVKVGEDNIQTIEFLFKDYVDHMEHHLKQIIEL